MGLAGQQEGGSHATEVPAPLLEIGLTRPKPSHATCTAMVLPVGDQLDGRVVSTFWPDSVLHRNGDGRLLATAESRGLAATVMEAGGPMTVTWTVRQMSGARDVDTSLDGCNAGWRW